MTSKPIFFSNHRSRKKVFHPMNGYGQIDLSNFRNNINILDIGFGDGDSIINARMKDNLRIYGIESYAVGVNKVVKFINSEAIKNVNIYHGDAVEIISFFPEKFFNCVNIFFPDPWPKRRHHKRRFVTKYFLDKLRTKVKTNNKIHIASDHINYIFDTKNILDKYLNRKVEFSNHRSDRPITKYENKAISKGNIIFDMIFEL